MTQELIRDAYSKSAGQYDSAGAAVFHPLGLKTIEVLDLKPGERVLDIGCGRGACLFPAAHQVGPSGFVQGIDQADGMVEYCASDIASRGVSNWVQVSRGDAQSFTFEEPFDAACAGMVLFLLPDPLASLQCTAEALRPGGRYVATTFPTEDGRLASGWESAEILADVLARFLPAGVENPWLQVLGIGGPLANAGSTADAVRTAGFSFVDVYRTDAVSRFESVDDYLKWTWTVTPRVLWELVPDSRMAEATDAVREALQVIAGPDGSVEFVCPTRTIVAVR